MSTTNGPAGPVTVTATRTGAPGRWVRLTLSLRGPGEVLKGLAHAARFNCAVEPLDELAATYELENWESGLLSGYFFACRRAGRTPPPPLRVSELVGALTSDDMDGVADAAAVAAAHLLGYDPAQLPTSPEWRVERAAAPVVV